MSPILGLLLFINWHFICGEARGRWNNFENNRIDEASNSNEVEEHPHDIDGKINLSMPGTKWCGPGSTASSYDDLGSQREVDMCCRSHDNCDNIPARETKYNLTNNDYFTRLNCDCDREFRNCLRNINSTVSNAVGRVYFTLRGKCYYEDNPIIKCEAYDTDYFIKRCIQYELDMRQPKRYQWFDIPLYRDKDERDAMRDEENII